MLKSQVRIVQELYNKGEIPSKVDMSKMRLFKSVNSRQHRLLIYC